MKKGIHPESYRLVAFKDMSNEHVFITRSCVNTRETIDIEGVTYPLVKVEISNTSHPFYTGKMKLVDTAGRVDKFYQRYKNRQNVTRTVRSNTLHQDTSEPHSITGCGFFMPAVSTPRESAGFFRENGSLSPAAMQKCRGWRCVYRAVVYHGLVHSASFF